MRKGNYWIMSCLSAVCALTLAGGIAALPRPAAAAEGRTIVDYDFSDASQGDNFTGNWSVKDGALFADSGWATAYLTTPIPLTEEDVTVSYDIVPSGLTDGSGDNYLIVAAGLVRDPAVTTAVDGLVVNINNKAAAHCISTVGSINGYINGWKNDRVVAGFDPVHVVITIANKVATLAVNGEAVMTGGEESVPVSVTFGDEVYFQVSATNAADSIDNLKITVGDVSEPEPDPEPAEWSDLDLDFETEGAVDAFEGPWTAKEGAFMPTAQWEIANTKAKAPLKDGISATVRFTLPEMSIEGQQIDFGFLPEKNSEDGGLMLHIHNGGDFGVLGTLNSNIGTSAGTHMGDWASLLQCDGSSYTATFTIKDGTAKVLIDGREENVAGDPAIDLDEAVFVLKSSSLAFRIEELKIGPVTADPEPEPGPEPAEWSDLDLDFETEGAVDAFEGPWTAAGGVYRPASVWTVAYTKAKAAIAEKEVTVSVELRLPQTAAEDEFELGFADTAEAQTGLILHFYRPDGTTRAILNGAIAPGSDVHWIAQWEGDDMTFFDGEVHTVTMSLKNGKGTVKIDGVAGIASGNPASEGFAFDWMEEGYFFLKSSSTDFSADNLTVTVGEPTPDPDPDPDPDEPAVWEDLDLSFNDDPDAAHFGGNWRVNGGAFVPAGAGESAYTKAKAPLKDGIVATVYFTLPDIDPEGQQIDFGFLPAKNATGGGLMLHFYVHAQYGVLATLNSSTLSSGTDVVHMGDWSGAVDFDGRTHVATFTIENGVAKVLIDGQEENVAGDPTIDLEEAVFVLKSTTPDFRIEELAIGAADAERPEELTDVLDVDFSSADAAGAFQGSWTVEDGKLVAGTAGAVTALNTVFRTEFSLDLTLSATDGGITVGILQTKSGTGYTGGYTLVWDEGGLALYGESGPAAASAVRLSSARTGALASDAAYALGGDLAVKIVAYGGKMAISANGADFYGDAFEPETFNAERGYITFTSRSATGAVKSVQAKRLSAAPWYGPAQGPEPDADGDVSEAPVPSQGTEPPAPESSSPDPLLLSLTIVGAVLAAAAAAALMIVLVKRKA